MIRATIGIFSQVGVTFDADAQAFFDRVDTAGGTLSDTEKEAVNQLVLDMKDDGIWNKMKAIYPMVGASAAACAQNLKSSSFTGTFTSGWTFASTGVTPNGTSAYMDTNFFENTNSILNNAHISFYSRTQKTTDLDKSDIGVIGFTPFYTAIFTEASGGVSGFACQSVISSQQISNSNTQGLFITTRRQSNQLVSFIRNVKHVANINTSNLATNSYYLGARNFNNSINSPSDKECAFASIGDGLSDTEASNINTAVQAFQTTLSRNV